MVSFKHKVRLNYLGELANPTLIFIFLGKQSQEFPKKLSKLVIIHFLSKLLVTYGSHIYHKKWWHALINFRAQLNRSSRFWKIDFASASMV